MKLLLLVAALLLLACASFTRPAPLVLRPDTRRFWSFQMDSTLTERAIAHFIGHWPNESALCLYGDVRDSLFAERGDTVTLRRVVITRLDSAIVAEATPFSVDYADYRMGCHDEKNLLARAHSHLYVPQGHACDHSDGDALNLMADKRILVSLVFCPRGEGQALWQDGRRMALVWGEQEM